MTLTPAEASIRDTFKSLRASLESSIYAARLELRRVAESLEPDDRLRCVLMLHADSSMVVMYEGRVARLTQARGGLDLASKWSHSVAEIHRDHWNRECDDGLEVEVVRVPDALGRILRNDFRLHEQMREMVEAHTAFPELEAELRQILGMALPEVGA